jgi:hypothetical protein
MALDGISMKREQRPVKVTLRFRPGQDDDLIQWLRLLNDLHFGAKSQAMKDALRRGLGMGSSQTGSELPGSSTGGVLDLAELRQVVEAAVDTALGRFEGQFSGGTRALAQEEDDETEALLDDLEAALVLEDA